MVIALMFSSECDFYDCLNKSWLHSVLTMSCDYLLGKLQPSFPSDFTDLAGCDKDRNLSIIQFFKWKLDFKCL